MRTKFNEIVDISYVGKQNPISNHDVFHLAMSEEIAPANVDEEKILFVGIDIQNDFLEKGELAVPNSHNDLVNTLEFLYRNLEKISTIAISLDTHSPMQIFHPCWWVDENNSHPAPFSIISLEDVVTGKWKAVQNQEESIHYVRQIERQGNKKLCIWPFHCIQGTYGAALEGQFSNMIHFHSLARKSPILKIVKGTDPLSEMYGMIKPEYDKKNYINQEFLDLMVDYDKIIFSGQAKSHCVLESLRQILNYYHKQLEITSKIYVLEDTMSCIPGFEESTKNTFDEFHSEYGIHLVNSKSLIL